MKNGKLYKGLIALIGLVMINAGIFLMIHEYFLTFWISYGFLMIAVLLNILIHVFATDTRTVMFGHSLRAIATTYLIVEFVAAVIFFIFSPFLALPAFIIQVIILAAFGICYINVFMTSSATAKQQELRGRDIMNFKYILEQMRNVQQKVPYGASYRKVVEHAYDSLASGQVRSSAEAEMTERAIIEEIDLLGRAVNTENDSDIIACCKKIEQLSEERNQKLHMKELF